MSKSFYLKVAYQNKIKKYLIQKVNQIKFHQIKQNLGLKEKWKDSLYYYQLVQNFSSPLSPKINYQQQRNIQKQNIIFTEQQLIQYLNNLVIIDKGTIKVKIIQKHLMSEQERRRKQSMQSLQIPQILQKKRSKSMQLQVDIFDQTCQTQSFQLTSNIFINQNYNQVKQENNENKIIIDNNRQQTIDKENNIKKNNQQVTIKSTYITKDNIQCKDNNQKINIKQSNIQKLFTKPNSIFSRSYTNMSNNLNNNNYSVNIKDQNNKMIGSMLSSKLLQSKMLSSSIDINKIRNCLHESIKMTNKQKSQLQKLKQKIKNKQKQKQMKNKKQQKQVNQVLSLFGIRTTNSIQQHYDQSQNQHKQQQIHDQQEQIKDKQQQQRFNLSQEQDLF